MPFTPTHIAAALPVAWASRWRAPFSALAIGCMICDLPVFFPQLISYWVTHSADGVITHCLPLGWLLYLGYHWMLKRPLCGLLPVGLARRAAPWANQPLGLSPQHVLIVTLCLLFGAGSHVLWDSFTHENRWGVRQFPGLNEVAFSLTLGSGPLRHVTWYSVLQHVSSLVFLPPMLIGWLVWLWRQPLAPQEQTPRAATAIKLLAIMVVVIAPVVAYPYCLSRFNWAPKLYIIHQTVKVSGAIILGALFAYASCLTLVSRAPSVERAIDN